MCISPRYPNIAKIISIPQEVQEEIEARVATFNATHMGKYKEKFVAIFKDKHVHLMTITKKHMEPGPICRMTYKGDINDMAFAMFLYSCERYDTDPFGCPGEEYIDGTVEGAMMAGCKTYLDKPEDFSMDELGEIYTITKHGIFTSLKEPLR